MTKRTYLMIVTDRVFWTDRVFCVDMRAVNRRETLQWSRLAGMRL